jgi:hypothetical protein
MELVAGLRSSEARRTEETLESRFAIGPLWLQSS